jgi:hypothetical protein
MREDRSGPRRDRNVEAPIECCGELDVLDRLASVPDRQGRAGDVAAVMEELQKSFLAFDNEVAKFLAVTLDSGQDLRADLAVLYSLEGDALWARVQTAHTRCSKIGAIHIRYLAPWFQRVTGLNASEREQLQRVFDTLGHIDGDLVGMLSPAAVWLGERARETLDAYEAGDVETARRTIAAARREILPTRRALAAALARMRDLEADFIEVAAIA